MRTLFILLFTALLTTLSGFTALADFQKTKIAVLDFRPQGSNFENDDMGKIVAEWLITAFVREGRFEVIERKLLGEVLEEQQMIEAGIVSQEAASELGKLLGVKVIISGSVAKIGKMVEVNARIVDVTSASIITAESVYSTDVSSLRDLVGEMARKIMKNFPLEGYIVHRANDEIVIDLGQRAGVREGMDFLVYQEGEVVKHPKTDEILYVGKIKTGLVRITAIQEKISIGTILEETDPGVITAGHQVTSTKSGETDNLLRESAQPVAQAAPQEPYRGAAPITRQPMSEPYRAATVAPQPVKTVQPAGQLFIDVVPPTARIRILNIVPGYYPGISLSAGDYQVEVSAPGYRTRTEWHSLGAGEIKRLVFTLEPFGPPVASPVPTVDPVLQHYLDMLNSRDSDKVRTAARLLHSRYGRNTLVVDTAHDVLRVRYRERPGDNDFVDAMAYLCNILGESGDSRQRDLLMTVREGTGSYKLRSYASKNLDRLAKHGSIGVTQPGRPAVANTMEVAPGPAVSSSEGGLRIAILPWDPRASSWFHIVLDAMVREIKKYPNLMLTHSYYKLFNEHEVSILDQDLMGMRRSNDLWEKKHLFAGATPEVARVADIGLRLGVDRVIMGRYDLREYGPSTFMDYLYIYVVDVHSLNLQEFKGSSSSDLYMGDYDIIHDTVTKTFRDIR